MLNETNTHELAQIAKETGAVTRQANWRTIGYGLNTLRNHKPSLATAGVGVKEGQVGWP